MDFLDSKRKKAHRARLFIGYSLMAVALAMSTVLILLLTSGYDVDRSTGLIIQNGLAIIDSHPVSADIFANGQPKGRTNQRVLLPEGSYDIELKANGYRKWQHKVTLEGSSIEQLVYPFLFPEKLVTKTINIVNALPPMVSQSPDRRWLVVQSATKFGTFELVDLNDKQNIQTEITMPSDSLTQAPGAHSFKEVEWASDNSNLLLEHNWPTGTEYILLNRGNALQSLNISKLFPEQAASKIRLRDKKTDQFYLYNPATRILMSGVSSTKTVTPLLTRVLQFKPYKDNTVLYVNESKEVHLLQKGRDYLIRILPEASNYMLEYAEFNNKAYLVAGSPSDGRTYVYENPLNYLNRVPARAPQPLRVLVVDKPEFVSFSAIARFVVVQSGSKFVVFDAETGRQFRYDTNLVLSEHQKAAWMDGHRIGLVSNSNKATIFDFDGTNMQTLVSSLPASQLYFNRDYDAVFSFAPGADNKVVFQRTELKIK